MSNVNVSRFDVVAEFTIDDSAFVTIEKSPSGVSLRWNDGVVNEWTEEYESLSVALARVAVLAACGEKDWEVGFVNDSSTFEANARDFLENETE